MAANAGETKVKLWEGICYPENMLDDWQEEIDDILQVPFAYAIHDIDHDQKSKQRKTHVHIIVVWGGNTTRKAIINVLNRLSADGKRCCSSAEPVNNIRHAYDYLIHDTASCRKKGKELYPVEVRIEGNNFDIGQLEQLSTKDKQDMLFELQDAVVSKEIEIDQLKSEVKRQRSTIDRLERTISGLEERLDKAVGNIIEIADTMRWRFEPQNWRKALSRLVDNPIAHAALAVRQNVARWVEKDARAADKVIKREVKSVRKELGALAAEAQQMRTSAKQLENERSSGRPESRSKGVDR